MYYYTKKAKFVKVVYTKICFSRTWSGIYYRIGNDLTKNICFIMNLIYTTHWHVFNQYNWNLPNLFICRVLSRHQCQNVVSRTSRWFQRSQLLYQRANFSEKKVGALDTKFAETADSKHSIFKYLVNTCIGEPIRAGDSTFSCHIVNTYFWKQYLNYNILSDPRDHELILFTRFFFKICFCANYYLFAA